MPSNDTFSNPIEALASVLADPFGFKKKLRDELHGKVRYGSFEKNHDIIIRRNADETKDYGRFDDQGEFVPFTKDQLRSFSISYGVDLPLSGTVLPFKKKGDV
jgi:hypothetical protein